MNHFNKYNRILSTLNVERRFILKENKKIINIGALIFLINGLFYLTGEYIAAIGTGYSLKEVYLRNFISSLGVYPNLIVEGVPVGFSKFAIVMNIDFIVTGMGFLVAYYFLIFKITPKFFLYFFNSCSICSRECISGCLSRWSSK